MSKGTGVLVTFAMLVMIAIFAVSYCGPGDLEQGRLLTTQLQWEPSAQFLGFYAAKEEGFYADEGLDVHFLHGGPNVDPISNVVNGNADIGLATADQVLRWNDKNPTKRLRAVGTVFDRSLAVFMVRADSGIESPADFAGKKIGVFPSYDTESLMLLLLRRVELDRDAVEQINFPNFANFENGDVDVYGAYVINEPQLAALRNLSVSLIDPVEYDIHFYSDTVIAREEFIKIHSDRVEAFLSASSRGWKYAEEDLDSALLDMRNQVGGVFGAGEPWRLQELIAQEAVKYLRGGPGNSLRMRREQWDHLATDLRSIGVITRPEIVSETCDFQFAESSQEVTQTGD